METELSLLCQTSHRKVQSSLFVNEKCDLTYTSSVSDMVRVDFANLEETREERNLKSVCKEPPSDLLYL